MAELYGEIKSILVDQKYPSINQMDEDECMMVLHGSNRYSLLSWIMCRLDNCFEDLLLKSEKNAALLEETLYDLGFCSSKAELSEFVRGVLKPSKELSIIHSILKFMVKMINLPPLDDDAPTTTHSIELLKLRDLNLFPMYGDIKLLKHVSGKSDMTREPSMTTTQTAPSLSPKEIGNIIKSIAEDVPKMKSLVGSPQEMKQFLNFDAETLRKCCDNMRIVRQLLDDFATIESFLKIQNEFQEEEENSLQELKSMLETLCLHISGKLCDQH